MRDVEWYRKYEFIIPSAPEGLTQPRTDDYFVVPAVLFLLRSGSTSQ